MEKSRSLDGRTRWVRRTRAIEKQLAAALGSDSKPHQMILLKAAAEQITIAEQTRSDYLAGRLVSINDVVRAQNAMTRAIKSLQIPESREEDDQAPTFIISPEDALL
jgi:hypothetical protein